jgi:hypothetical protein
LPFIHWFDWIEPNTTEDLSVIVGNMDVTWRMIANLPFKNISATTNPTHSKFESGHNPFGKALRTPLSLRDEACDRQALSGILRLTQPPRSSEFGYAGQSQSRKVVEIEVSYQNEHPRSARPQHL